jgi:murein DD-endopeptidase MepM/ murein hydrolase activator NlpD
MKNPTASICLTIAVLLVGGCQTTTYTYPSGAPKIDSGFGSFYNIKGGPRSAAHQGIDISGKDGQEILAVADGTVLEATVEKCWGPTIAVDHGNAIDGNKIIALYGHVGEMLVAEGDKVKRGQLIAHLGNNQDNFECIGGVRHLHFQIGRKYRDQFHKGTAWGHTYFLEDGQKGINPHLYWADGPNKVTCFESSKKYKLGTITYPVPCR